MLTIIRYKTPIAVKAIFTIYISLGIYYYFCSSYLDMLTNKQKNDMYNKPPSVEICNNPPSKVESRHQSIPQTHKSKN